jgi:hypothetical protein
MRRTFLSYFLTFGILMAFNAFGADEGVPYKRKVIKDIECEVGYTVYKPPLFLTDGVVQNRSEKDMPGWYQAYRSFYSLRNAKFEQWMSYLSSSYIAIGQITKTDFDEAKKLQVNSGPTKATVFYQVNIRWNNKEYVVLGATTEGWLNEIPKDKVGVLFFVNSDGGWKRHILEPNEDWIRTRLPLFDIVPLSEAIKAEENEVDASSEKLKPKPKAP